MVELSVQNIVKAFEEGNDLLTGLSFNVYTGERVGLLGKNGSGKTTLFRMLVGELQADEGKIVIQQGKKLGLISQIPQYPEDYRTEDVLKSAHRRLYQVKAQIEELEAKMDSDSSRELLQTYDSLLTEFQRDGGYALDVERNRVANGLEIPKAQRSQLFSTLSGGEKTRVNLGRLILEKTDILLLDEPTNHLDLRATEWLEDYLKSFQGTVLVISHDRYFLDRVVGRIVEIKDGKSEFYSGNYSFYVQEKERRFVEQQKKYEREQSEAKRLQEAADRLYQWGTGNKNLMKKSFAIEKRIDRLVKTERPGTERKMRSSISEKEFHGDDVLVIKGLEKSYGDKLLFKGADLTVRKGERIALIGDNGTGKSTLLNMIVGEEKMDAGFIRRGPSVKTAYLPQIVLFQHPEHSVLDTLVRDEGCSPQSARNRLGAFKFPGEDVFKPIGQLSGGEQSRLRMCILMNDDINFLILDEPTNHLDLLSREWIEDAVEEYGEALLFVSHDRYFISRFATRIWEIEAGAILDFPGTFEQYKAYKSAQENSDRSRKATERAKKPAKKKQPSKAKQLQKLERDIERAEQQLREIEKQQEQYASDYEKLMELDEAMSQAEIKLEGLYDEWEYTAEA